MSNVGGQSRGGGSEAASLKQLDGRFRRMPNVALRHVRREFAIYGREARDEIKANTPKLTGNLHRSIKLKGTKPTNGIFSYRVIASREGGRTGKGYHYHLVEFGTKRMVGRFFAKPTRDRFAGTPATLLDRANKALEKAMGEE